MRLKITSGSSPARYARTTSVWRSVFGVRALRSPSVASGWQTAPGSTGR